MNKLVKESINDVLKPKDLKQGVKDAAQQLMLELLENKVITFYSPKQPTNAGWFIRKHPSKHINDTLDKLNRDYGYGLYVIIKKGVIPMQYVYPNKIIPWHNKDIRVIQYNIPSTQLETALRELIACTMSGKFGTWFSVIYYDKINESNLLNLFKPKTEEEIIDNIWKNVLKKYNEKSVMIHLNINVPEISSPYGDYVFNGFNKEYGNGFYIMFPDMYSTNKINKGFEILEIEGQLVGITTYRILNKRKHECLIKYFVKEILNGDLNHFSFKNFK